MKKTPKTSNGLTKVNLSKGCYLLLTHEEYANGIRRGKIERRRVALKKRIDKEQSRQNGNEKYFA